MNPLDTTSTIPTADALERQWRQLGFIKGAPVHIPAALVAGDVRIYQRLACPACGHRRHAVQPLHRGRIYRLLCRCKKCGAGMEA